MKKIILSITLLLAFLAISTEAAVSGECPLSSQHTSCSPKCIQDSECSSTGGKCCPNLCNYKSCIRPQSGTQGGGTGYKGTGGAGTYCGNVKCNPYEKCEMDRVTKRQKCTRS